MHLVHDENGNLCGHAHPHEHAHTHPHEHSHAHPHEEGHGDGSCGQAVCGSDCGGCQGQGDKTAALLDYMYKHNEHHAAELDQVAEKLRSEGRDGAADQIKKAVDEFQKGNMYLSLALSMVQNNR